MAGSGVKNLEEEELARISAEIARLREEELARVNAEIARWREEEFARVSAEIARLKEEELKQIEALKEEIERAKTSPDHFFLRKANHPGTYKTADERYSDYQAALERGETPAKKIKEPAEQLSAKGLAVMSHLYSQIDHSEAQPLICDSVSSLKHITKLVDNAPVGTNVTIILQPLHLDDPNMLPDVLDAWKKNFSSVHKTVLKFEKTQEGLRVISMDGTDNPWYSTLPVISIEQALRENADENKKPVSKLSRYRSEMVALGAQSQGDARQKSSFECGIFATKDARELNRDHHFYEEYLTTSIPNEETGEHVFHYPVQYVKGMQSSTTYNKFLTEFGGDEKATRKGKTLQETFEKYGDSYANHFALKYNEKVNEFLTTHTPREIQEAVQKYDAAFMTHERLVSTYGPSAPAIRVAPVLHSSYQTSGSLAQTSHPHLPHGAEASPSSPEEGKPSVKHK